MDRDFILAVLSLITAGLTLLGAAPWSLATEPQPNARRWERSLWRALWLPSVPVVGIISILIGWALVEPDVSDERLPMSALILTAPLIVLWGRALIRAIRAVVVRTPPVAGTVGVLRARMVLSDTFVAQLDAEALAAVKAHEATHVRHRDPLRIWIAQLITDLQWPWPAARRRFALWRQVLELARDEEARLTGVDGADLAEAVLVAVRLQPPSGMVASLIDGRRGLEERIRRLLGPVPTSGNPVRRTSALALLSLCALGIISGVRFGDVFVQTLVRWL